MPSHDTRLAALQGRWRIESSTGQPDAGMVFLPAIGKDVIIRRAILVFPDDDPASELRKTLRVLPEPNALAIDHRGNFAPTDPLDGDAQALGRESKGWSRRVLAKVEGDVMTLAVAFPQDPLPPSFAPSDRSEVVVLRRIR
ncbi:MAG: hypothetical protein KC731_26970 [Myxococcales bacterium]|nr:hypothetical protein [Myxococcales bacterium]